jgi:signal transduction histidine kinase
MSETILVIIFLFYGLAFFSMGLAILLEVGRGSDERLRHALRPLAAFGLLHGLHEWLEMLEILGALPGFMAVPEVWHGIRLGLLAFSFLSLGAFGASLLAPTERWRRLSLLVPLAEAGVWGLGLFALRGSYSADLWDVADVWTRYVLAIPSSLITCAGLIALQRAFRRAGMAKFGRDSLWAAVAFVWYGLAGQVFTRSSSLPPSNLINQELFLELFGFPVQLLRAAASLVAAVFIIRVLRSFEVETQRQIADLQSARLREAQRREALRSEYLKRVVNAQEAERQRIARELHDETGQALTALGLGLRGATATLYQNQEKAERQLRHLEDLVAHSLEELNRLIADLRPSHLDDLGLLAALRWYAGEVKERSNLPVSITVEGTPQPISPTVKTALFRVAQEALINVIKHADANHVYIKLFFEDQKVGIWVEDDGCGFDVGKIRGGERQSWGLMGMEERANLLGGEFRLDSEEGVGTKILVTLPNTELIEDEDEDTSVDRG